jgi:predicted metal-binding membrane protein
MLALGALMALEKNMPWGRRVSTPLGVALVAGAMAVSGFSILNLA